MVENELILNQRGSLGFDTQIKLISGRELQVVSKRKKAEQRYSIDILSLQEKSKVVTLIAWKWLFSCATFFVFMLLMLKFLPSYLSENKNLYLGVILLVGILGCILSIIKFWKNTSRKVTFYSKNAHVPILKLDLGKPSKEVFSTFISALEKRIHQFQSHMELPDDKQLIGEMKMLRRLSDDSVISKKDYEMAKAKLFSGFDNQDN